MFSAEAVASGLIWAEMSFMAAIWPPRARPDSARVKYITLNVQVQLSAGQWGNNLKDDDNRSG